jgi:hypothetical protein
MNNISVSGTSGSINFTNLSFGEKFQLMSECLDSCAGTEKLKLLRSLAGQNGHRVLPGLGTQQVAAVRPTQVMSRPKASAQPRSSKSAEQKKIDAKITELNSKIKAKSSSLGARLTETDPLIQERLQLFRAKHGKEAISSSPHCGESC